jgi:hypothetical protein
MMKKKKPSTTARTHKTVEERLKISEEMYSLLADRYERLRKSFGVTINVLVAALEMKDPYTVGHPRMWPVPSLRRWDWPRTSLKE